MLWEERGRAALRLANDLEGENALWSVLRFENKALPKYFVFDLLFRNPKSSPLDCPFPSAAPPSS